MQRLAQTLLLSLLILTATLPVHAQTDREKKQQELEQLRQRIGLLRDDLDQTRNHYDDLRSQLRKSERQIGRLSRSLMELEAQLTSTRQRLEQLRKRQATLEQAKQEQRGYLTGQIRAAYLMGRQEYFKILLNQQEPATVGRVAAYYDYLNRARSSRIATISGTLTELERVRGHVRSEVKRIDELRRVQLTEREALEASRSERAQLVQRLKREINSKDSQLEQMVRDEQQLQQLLMQLVEALEDIPAEPGDRKPFASLRGKLKWPARGPILERYGSDKVGELNWTGVMIGAGEGHAVRAVSHGRIAFADWLKGYGLLVIIDHGDGFMSLYGHNQSLFKETGDWVEVGEQIATVGNSGGAEQIALYFEIRQNGKPTNPGRWCKK